jgi:outer membrane lipoprotein-sorting protein
MNKKAAAAVLLALALLLPAAYAEAMAGAVEPENDLDRVRALFREGQVLHALMTHELTDSYTGETQEVSGVLWISSDKYKIRADHQTVLVNGVISMVYNERQNKLIISEYEPEDDDFAPSRFFSDDDELFRVTGTKQDGNGTEFTLSPEDPFEIFTEVIIRLGTDLTPDHIRATDQMDNLLVTRFTGARFLDYSDEFFEMEYPEDAEIIDLRK